MVVVPLIADQIHVIGKRVGLLKKEIAVSWLAEVDLTSEGSG